MYFTTSQRVVERFQFEMRRTKRSVADIADSSVVPRERVQTLCDTGRAPVRDTIAISDVFNIEPSNFYEG